MNPAEVQPDETRDFDALELTIYQTLGSTLGKVIGPDPQAMIA